ncbi:hypothetical protein PGTUg99_036353 [Puccinia graminis f. sp. tritici]|uniref:Uncharacterized protein n=1 Tax=Puccinia graminis f. sp. tritici TaxID=56615 RepID=A0A5B0SH89_PUCGR|nr:hypothetical protein PGTUg99_036353 [Puccinia graminis f. sp. tritici]
MNDIEYREGPTDAVQRPPNSNEQQSAINDLPESLLSHYALPMHLLSKNRSRDSLKPPTACPFRHDTRISMSRLGLIFSLLGSDFGAQQTCQYLTREGRCYASIDTSFDYNPLPPLR